VAAEHLSCKLRDVSTDSETRTFTGLASVFGNVDLGGDIVMPGAFTKSLNIHRANGSMPAMLFLHRMESIPGKWLDMRETDTGLHVKGKLSNTPLGSEMHELLKDGSLGGLSIGYLPTVSDFDRSGNRLLKEVDLFEVSLVPLPMNVRATVTPGSIKELPGLYTVTQFERLSRSVYGMTRQGAARFASKAWRVYKAAQTGEPIEENQLDEIKNTLESAQFFATLQHFTDKVRGI
jgi:hypothetical protein